VSTDPQPGRTQRQINAARNQSLFREVNERIEGLRPLSTFVEFICECCDERCAERVELTREEYETMRANPNQFAVKPSHVAREVEVVLYDNARYAIVSKIGAGAAVAAQLDPRRS
jgi:hypothetical protein